MLILHHTGIVFNNLEGENLEYTLRLRHEVGQDKSWETRDAAPNFQPSGPRVTNKSVNLQLQIFYGTHKYTSYCIVF